MKLPSVDSPFMEKANDISDLLIVNILYFIVCIPIFTIGAATSALYYTSFCYQDKKPHGGMTFLRAFKENFKNGTILFFLLLIPGLLIALDYYLSFTMQYSGYKTMIVVLIPISVIYLLVTPQAFLLQSHFNNTVLGQLRNALLLSLGYLPRAFLVSVLMISPIVFPLWSVDLFLRIMPVFFLFWHAVISLLQVKLMRPAYTRLEEAAAAAAAAGPEAEEDPAAEMNRMLANAQQAAAKEDPEK